MPYNVNRILTECQAYLFTERQQNDSRMLPYFSIMSNVDKIKLHFFTECVQMTECEQMTECQAYFYICN